MPNVEAGQKRKGEEIDVEMMGSAVWETTDAFRSSTVVIIGRLKSGDGHPFINVMDTFLSSMGVKTVCIFGRRLPLWVSL